MIRRLIKRYRIRRRAKRIAKISEQRWEEHCRAMSERVRKRFS